MGALLLGGGRTIMLNFSSEWGRDPSPPRMFCVTVKHLPVSNGTVQLTGSGERTTDISGDLTRVGSASALISVAGKEDRVVGRELGPSPLFVSSGWPLRTFSFSSAEWRGMTLTGGAAVPSK